MEKGGTTGEGGTTGDGHRRGSMLLVRLARS
jgi:hypothetical protein